MEARPVRTTRYVLEIEDKTGTRHSVRAMGLDTITVLPPDPDLSPISGLVQGYPPEVLQRPQGDVDLLLGLRDSYLHGCTVRQWGNLRLLESPLGCGWALRGTHPDLAKPTSSVPAYALPNADREQGPRGVRDDGKLGGLGHATLGRSIILPCGSPSPPLLHEDKLSGPGSGGPEVVRLRQEGKLTLLHEVKLSGPVAGGPDVVRLRQEGKLVLQHEVKLCRPIAGGGVDIKTASRQAGQDTIDPAPPVPQSIGPSANYQGSFPTQESCSSRRRNC